MNEEQAKEFQQRVYSELVAIMTALTKLGVQELTANHNFTRIHIDVERIVAIREGLVEKP